jgi:streptomycin 6-kinase
MSRSPVVPEFAVPAAVIEAHSKDASALPWLNFLPELAAGYLDRWTLMLAGEPLYGAASLVLPVVRQDTDVTLLG